MYNVECQSCFAAIENKSFFTTMLKNFSWIQKTVSSDIVFEIDAHLLLEIINAEKYQKNGKYFYVTIPSSCVLRYNKIYVTITYS